MAQRFRGESLHKVDGKGRVSIPASFRRTIEANDPNWREGLRPRLIITYGNPNKRCLECYTVEAAEDVERRIERMVRGSPERRFLEWMFNSRSSDVEIDPDGRLVIPPVAREAVGLGEQAYFVGMGDTFQVWQPELYERDVAGKMAEFYASLPEGVDPLTFLPADA